MGHHAPIPKQPPDTSSDLSVDWQVLKSATMTPPIRGGDMSAHPLHQDETTRYKAHQPGKDIAHHPQSRDNTPQKHPLSEIRRSDGSRADIKRSGFFDQVQTQQWPYLPAPFVWAVTPTMSASVPPKYPGTTPRLDAPETKDSGWSTRAETSFAQTGSSHEDAGKRLTTSVTSAPDAESRIMGLKAALEHKRLNPGTPYKPEVWKRLLQKADLLQRYPSLPHNLQHGFDAGIPKITKTFTPPNKPSITQFAAEFDRITQEEINKGRYLGPLSKTEVEQLIGPFQTSPLSIIPKTTLGKFRSIQDLSFPHNPTNGTSSINSAIDASQFPCTWGTFTIISLLISRLPPGSQAAVRDVKEAYRTIPIAPTQWPGLVVRLREADSFAIDTRDCFGLASGGGCYGVVGDAGAQLMRKAGIGPLSKWVDDHIFFRILKIHLVDYNKRRALWADDIAKNGGEKHHRGRLWFQGRIMPNDRFEEFDEDASAPLQDLSNASPRSNDDHKYSYSMQDIDDISDELGIPWEASKDIQFANEVPFIGFSWDLEARTVTLPDKKKKKYIQAIVEWESSAVHDLQEAQKLYGKLLHTCLVIPAGRAYLTNLESFMGVFGNNPFMPRHPPRGTPHDLFWWKTMLSNELVSRPIPAPGPIVDIQAYSDASSETGIAITIGAQWRAWRLLPGWKTDQRDIGWAEAVGFALLVSSITQFSHSGTHYKVYGDNAGVVEGWWTGRSRNKQTNNIFKLIHDQTKFHGITIHTRYVPSKLNPADDPSRGRYYAKNLLLPIIQIPQGLRQYIVNFDAPQQLVEQNVCGKEKKAKPLPKPDHSHTKIERCRLNDDSIQKEWIKASRHWDTI